MHLNHYAVRTNDLESLKEFFCDVAELSPGNRPPLRFPGYWLYDAKSGAPVVHLIGTEKTPGNDTGASDHIAFTGDGSRYEEIFSKVEGMGYPYEYRTQVGSGLRQIFITGPHGIVVELSFTPAA